MSETTTATKMHVLVATLDPCPECTAEKPCAECIENGDLNFTIECPGVEVGRCNLWEECADCKLAGRKPYDEYGEDDLTAHGVEHQEFNGVMCTETDRCYVQSCDIDDAAWHICRWKPGRFPVDWESGDPGDCYLHPIKG